MKDEFNFNNYIVFLILYFTSNNNYMGIGDWGLGIGDWGLGIGDWAQSPIPNPQSPIPNPHFIFIFFLNCLFFNLYLI